MSLVAGSRFATADGQTGWIVSVRTDTSELAITKLAVVDGAASTTSIQGTYPTVGSDGTVVADGSGDLWLTASGEFLKIDLATGKVETIDLPRPAEDAMPRSEDPTAGYVYGAAWDAQSGGVLFVREGDHRLYRLDPGTGTVSTGTDLPILTTASSRVAVGGDGTLGVNGQALHASIFTPTAAWLAPNGGPAKAISDVLAVCGGPAGLLTLHRNADVQIGGDPSEVLANLGLTLTTSNPVVACDALGNFFAADYVANAGLSDEAFDIVRVSADGTKSVIVQPVTKGVVEGRQPGETPRTSFSGPDLRALLPDGSGGVWMVNANGTPPLDSSGYTPNPFPSIWRADFSR